VPKTRCDARTDAERRYFLAVNVMTSFAVVARGHSSNGPQLHLAIDVAPPWGAIQARGWANTTRRRPPRVSTSVNLAGAQTTTH